MVLSVAWRIFAGDEFGFSPPMVFMGVVYFAAAWFSYLKNDGFKFRVFNNTRNNKVAALSKSITLTHNKNKGSAPCADADAYDEDSETAVSSVSIISSLISGVLLIALSFLLGPSL